jgi:hypothetical protein
MSSEAVLPDRRVLERSVPSPGTAVTVTWARRCALLVEQVDSASGWLDT